MVPARSGTGVNYKQEKAYTMRKSKPEPQKVSEFPIKNYKAYSLRNFRKIPQMERLSEEDKFAIEVVGSVLPFKVNNYVIDELINWDDVPNDPMFILTFPTKDLLIEDRKSTRLNSSHVAISYAVF